MSRTTLIDSFFVETDLFVESAQVELSGVDSNRARQSGGLGDDGMLNVDAIADAYWMLHTQHSSTWTLELDLRPYKESF